MSEQRPEDQSAEVYIAERRGWLADAVKLVAGNVEANPRKVFAPPSDVRGEATPRKLSLSQENNLREIAGRFGIGGEVDVPAAADYEIIEGGLAWKIQSEAAIATGKRIFAGSINRKLREDELAHLSKNLSEGATLPETEYDLARFIAAQASGFKPHDEEKVLPFGYELNVDNSFVARPTGQLVEIGTTDGAPTYLLRVDREDFVDETGASKYRYQPDGTRLMVIIERMLDATGDQGASVGLLTSSTYASRAIGPVRAGLMYDREFRVGMYGRQTLAKVRDALVSEPPEIQQIPGELYVIAEQLDFLEAELKSQN